MQHPVRIAASAAVAIAVGAGAFALMQREQVQISGSAARAQAHSPTLTAAYFDSAAAAHQAKVSHRRDLSRQLGSLLQLRTILRR